MGAGVAQVTANAGHQVLLFDVAAGAAQKGIDNTARGLDKLVQRGRISQQLLDDLIARISPVDNIEELAPASLFIEAIIEKLEVKQELFKQLDDIGEPEAILATNTSSISVSAIASVLKCPERLHGMHFFNPAPVMKLVEIIGLLQKTGKQITQIDDIARMYMMRTVCMLANEGADAVNQQVCSINAVDIAMQGGLNYPAGPLAWADSIGIDNVLDILDNLCQNYGEDRYRPSPLIVRKAAAGKSFHE